MIRMPEGIRLSREVKEFAGCIQHIILVIILVIFIASAHLMCNYMYIN